MALGYLPDDSLAFKSRSILLAQLQLAGRMAGDPTAVGLSRAHFCVVQSLYGRMFANHSFRQKTDLT
ncbi:MAG: hypothetical protein HC924_04445 [Synechococcaceae cyanobacterium SM2_3_2]|nr:hypothetical protein [Synechococcaceae cyanobacterium SM2_3_2]